MITHILETLQIPKLFAAKVRALGSDLELLFARLADLESREHPTVTQKSSSSLSQRARLRRKGKAYRRTSLALDEPLKADLEAEVSRRKSEGRSADVGQVIREGCLSYLELLAAARPSTRVEITRISQAS